MKELRFKKGKEKIILRILGKTIFTKKNKEWTKSEVPLDCGLYEAENKLAESNYKKYIQEGFISNL